MNPSTIIHGMIQTMWQDNKRKTTMNQEPYSWNNGWVGAVLELLGVRFVLSVDLWLKLMLDFKWCKPIMWVSERTNFSLGFSGYGCDVGPLCLFGSSWIGHLLGIVSCRRWVANIWAYLYSLHFTQDL